METPDLPAINWFVHVLAENVGHVTWDGPNHTPIDHPIPEGNDIILKDDGKYTIKCNSLYTKNLIIELAKRFKLIEDENYRLRQEKRADQWHLVSEIPERWTAPHSSIRFHNCLVTSPALRYIGVGGVCKGLFNGQKKKWYVELNGKWIEHEVTHWRYIPPTAASLLKFEEVKEEVERLKEKAGPQAFSDL